MQPPAPQVEHQWLDRMAGEWTFTTECSMGPDQPLGLIPAPLRRTARGR